VDDCSERDASIEGCSSDCVRFFSLNSFFFSFCFRYSDHCYDVCPQNYLNKTGQTEPDYLCEPKTCENRRPFQNNSCSLAEDNENDICYFYVDELGGKWCVTSCLPTYVPVCSFGL
jgi:hypothetical protein